MAVPVNLRLPFQDEVQERSQERLCYKTSKPTGLLQKQVLGTGGASPALQTASRTCAVVGLADVDFEAADPAGDEIVNRCSDCCSDAPDDAVADRKNND